MSEPVSVLDVPDQSRYELSVDGAVASYLVYRRTPGLLDLQHTVTADGFEGRGLAGDLVAAVLSQARAAGSSVRPTCPYVRRYLARHPDQLDLVTPDDREAFELG